MAIFHLSHINISLSSFSIAFTLIISSQGTHWYHAGISIRFVVWNSLPSSVINLVFGTSAYFFSVLLKIFISQIDGFCKNLTLVVFIDILYL